MIKLGKLTDYAVVLMARLSHESVARSAPYLSEQTGISEPTVAKVLKKLARAGLVESLRGPSGGYRLPRAAAQISVADIITAMEGPIAIASCVSDAGEGCKTGARCPARGKWDGVNRAIRDALAGISLSDMAAPRPVFNLTPPEEAACR